MKFLEGETYFTAYQETFIGKSHIFVCNNGFGKKNEFRLLSK